MPELPEVETVARELTPKLVGKRLKQAIIIDPKLSNRNFSKFSGSSVRSVLRIGKEVVVEFNRDSRTPFKGYLAVHLRMSGRLICSSFSANKILKMKEDEILLARHRKRHLRALFDFRGVRLLFIDPRRFGTIRIFSSLEAIKTKGIDPLEQAFTRKRLRELLSSSVQPLKPWLIRQDRLTGLGNIYASEILFESQISPFRKAGSLKDDEISQLHHSTKAVLKRAIKNCGTTFSDFLGANGEVGQYQKYLRVYDREGEECKRCRSMILKTTQAQRSTYYCSNCQS